MMAVKTSDEIEGACGPAVAIVPPAPSSHSLLSPKLEHAKEPTPPPAQCNAYNTAQQSTSSSVNLVSPEGGQHRGTSSKQAHVESHSLIGCSNSTDGSQVPPPTTSSAVLPPHSDRGPPTSHHVPTTTPGLSVITSPPICSTTASQSHSDKMGGGGGKAAALFGDSKHLGVPGDKMLVRSLSAHTLSPTAGASHHKNAATLAAAAASDVKPLLSNAAGRRGPALPNALKDSGGPAFNNLPPAAKAPTSHSPTPAGARKPTDAASLYSGRRDGEFLQRPSHRQMPPHPPQTDVLTSSTGLYPPPLPSSIASTIAQLQAANFPPSQAPPGLLGVAGFSSGFPGLSLPAGLSGLSSALTVASSLPLLANVAAAAAAASASHPSAAASQPRSSAQTPSSATAAGGAGPSPKKRGKWCAMHVRIAWEIHKRQQELNGTPQSNTPTTPAPPSNKPPPAAAVTTDTTLGPPSATAVSYALASCGYPTSVSQAQAGYELANALSAAASLASSGYVTTSQMSKLAGMDMMLAGAGRMAPSAYPPQGRGSAASAHQPGSMAPHHNASPMAAGAHPPGSERVHSREKLPPSNMPLMSMRESSGASLHGYGNGPGSGRSPTVTSNGQSAMRNSATTASQHSHHAQAQAAYHQMQAAAASALANGESSGRNRSRSPVRGRHSMHASSSNPGGGPPTSYNAKDQARQGSAQQHHAAAAAAAAAAHYSAAGLSSSRGQTSSSTPTSREDGLALRQQELLRSVGSAQMAPSSSVANSSYGSGSGPPQPAPDMRSVASNLLTSGYHPSSRFMLPLTPAGNGNGSSPMHGYPGQAAAAAAGLQFNNPQMMDPAAFRSMLSGLPANSGLGHNFGGLTAAGAEMMQRQAAAMAKTPSAEGGQQPGAGDPMMELKQREHMLLRLQQHQQSLGLPPGAANLLGSNPSAMLDWDRLLSATGRSPADLLGQSAQLNSVFSGSNLLSQDFNREQHLRLAGMGAADERYKSLMNNPMASADSYAYASRLGAGVSAGAMGYPEAMLAAVARGSTTLPTSVAGGPAGLPFGANFSGLSPYVLSPAAASSLFPAHKLTSPYASSLEQLARQKEAAYLGSLGASVSGASAATAAASNAHLSHHSSR